MINVSADPLKAAGKLLNRLKFTKASLPVLNHLRLRAFGDQLTIAVNTLDQWLETTLPLAEPIDEEECFLIPAAAFKAALKADKASTVSFTRAGRKGAGVVKLSVTTGGITVNTGHPTLEVDEFPECPVLNGTPIEIPARTIEMMGEVSTCASRDETRHILNGVFFTPVDGGMVVATDGRRLAGAPATVPAEEFILPTPAVHVLGCPAFAGSPCRVTVADVAVAEDDEQRFVRFQSGDHLLISRAIEGNYPNWKQVVPKDMVASVTIPEDQRQSLVKWLRTLSARDQERNEGNRNAQLNAADRDPNAPPFEQIGITLCLGRD